MKFKNGEIEGVITKKLTRFSDERGYLVETFRTDNLPNKLKPMMSFGIIEKVASLLVITKN